MESGGKAPDSTPGDEAPPDAPRRVQLSRRKGWRMPPNTVVVARPSRWGNPFRIGQALHVGLSFSGRDEVVADGAHAVRLFRAWMFTQARSADLVPLLRGKNLACWCPLDQPCHADVLLELANSDPAQSTTLGRAA